MTDFSKPMQTRTDWQGVRAEIAKQTMNRNLAHSDATAKSMLMVADVLVLVGREIQRVADALSKDDLYDIGEDDL